MTTIYFASTKTNLELCTAVLRLFGQPIADQMTGEIANLGGGWYSVEWNEPFAHRFVLTIRDSLNNAQEVLYVELESGQNIATATPNALWNYQSVDMRRLNGKLVNGLEKLGGIMDAQFDVVEGSTVNMVRIGGDLSVARKVVVYIRDGLILKKYVVGVLSAPYDDINNVTELMLAVSLPTAPMENRDHVRQAV